MKISSSPHSTGEKKIEVGGHNNFIIIKSEYPKSINN